MKRFRVDEDTRFGVGLILLVLLFIGSVGRAGWIMGEDRGYCRGYDQGYGHGYQFGLERAMWPKEQQ